MWFAFYISFIKFIPVYVLDPMKIMLSLLFLSSARRIKLNFCQMPSVSDSKFEFVSTCTHVKICSIHAHTFRSLQFAINAADNTNNNNTNAKQHGEKPKCNNKKYNTSNKNTHTQWARERQKRGEWVSHLENTKTQGHMHTHIIVQRVGCTPFSI